MKPNGEKSNGAVAVADKPVTMRDYILKNKHYIKEALPQAMDAERFARIVLLNVNQNPALAQCSGISVLAAAMQAAQLGLEPGGVLGQAYLIPYKGKAQFQIGYKGMIELCRRSGSIQTIMAHAVHEHDDFDFAYGFNEKLEHKPALDNRGEPIAFYAYAIMKDGSRAFVVMSKQDVEEHRDRFSQAHNKSSSPWQTDFSAMAKKTVIKQLLKYLPVSVELLKQVETDGAVREVVERDLIDVPTDEIVFSLGDDDEPVESKTSVDS